MSQQTERFYVDGFLLRILNSAYLVEVEPAEDTAARDADPANLPGWIFKSSHAIWLMRANAPLVDRAKKGDEIKQTIMTKGVKQ